MADASTSEANESKKRHYTQYSDVQRLEIAKYAVEHGPAQAARHFSEEFQVPVNESSVRYIKQQYISRIETGQPKKKRGRPSKKDKEMNVVPHGKASAVAKKHSSPKKTSKSEMLRMVQLEAKKKKTSPKAVIGESTVSSNEEEEENEDESEDEEEDSDDNIAAIPIISTPPRKRRYTEYSDQQRLDIAVYAAEHGSFRASKHFTSLLGFQVNESSVRYILRQYHSKMSQKLISNDAEPLLSLPKGKRGRPTLLRSHHDQAVQQRVQSILDMGGTVNRSGIIAIGQEVLATQRRPSNVPVNLGRAWAGSMMNRMGIEKRKYKTKAKAPPTTATLSPEKRDFIERVITVIKESTIPGKLFHAWGNWVSN
jgi:hypothetical protein